MGGGKIVLYKTLQKKGETQRRSCRPHRGVVVVVEFLVAGYLAAVKVVGEVDKTEEVEEVADGVS